MNKQVAAVILIVAVAAAAVLFFFVLKPRPQIETVSPAQVKEMPFDQLFALANKCAETKTGDNCTLILEVTYLKAQHAKKGESFWMNQAFRLGDWYTYVGTKDWKSGQPDAPEIKKAAELYDWLLENKPFFGDRAYLGYARLYDSPYNADWARLHGDEARKYYELLLAKFPASTYAAAATAALGKR
jgi:hypothetical protein